MPFSDTTSENSIMGAEKSENVGKCRKKSEKCQEKSENHKKTYFPTIFRCSSPMMEIYNTGNANLFPMPLMEYSLFGNGNSRRILTFPMAFFYSVKLVVRVGGGRG